MMIYRFDLAHRGCAAAVLGMLLAGCAGPVPPSEVVPAAPAAPDAPSQPESPPPPDSSPMEPQPVAPIEAPVAQSLASRRDPDLAQMRTAIPGAKMTVAVDLRYHLDGAALPNLPVTLHLAAVPRVSGTNLSVSVRPVEGVQLAATPLSVQKASADGVYRQQLSITRLASAPAGLRVLVTMDMPAGSGFGFFTIPLDAGTNSPKQNSVKQP
jgi:hypothetical protein